MDEIMPKTMRNVFDDKLTFVNLMNAHNRAKVNKTNKYELLRFEMDLENNIANLMRQIKLGQYHIGRYRDFIIYEPKERLIRALPYRDRIVPQWYVYEFIKPYILPRLISDTFACIDDRGTHKAVSRIQKYMRIMKRHYGEYYILKCDIKKFFYSIDKKVLFEIMKKYISDKHLLAFTHLIIFDEEENIGIPIGNYTSQFFANIYLNELDQFVKHQLKVKYYVRYMDDFICLVKTKEEAKELKAKIEKFINEMLHLSFNQKSRYYPNKMGVDFCGYRIFETHRLLRVSSKRKIKRMIKGWNRLYQKGVLNEHWVLLRWNSWNAHAKQSDSYHFREKMYNSITFQDLLPPP